MKYKYLLFDLDGTLFDYDKAEKVSLRKTFEDFRIDNSGSYLEEYRKVNKKIWLDYESGQITQRELKTERFRRLGKVLELDIDPELFGKLYLKNITRERYLISGVIQLLEELSNDQFKMYLITNGLKDVQRGRLSGSEITQYFSDVFISEEIGAAKPDKAIFDEAFSRMGDPKRGDVVIIGDSLSSDISGGSAYGIDTCWFNPGEIKNGSGITPTYEIKGLLELRHILS